jgi:hypothetical protein
MDLDEILAKAGGSPAPRKAAPEAPAGPDLDAILAKAGGAPAAPAAAPVAPRTAPLAPAIPEPSLWESAKAGLRDVARPFVDLGKGALAANDFAARSMFHPVDTLGTPEKRAAALREGMRGVNSNIPFANTAVQAMGGPAAESPEDAAAAPGARAFGSVAGIPVGGMVGSVAGKVAGPLVEKVAEAKAARAERGLYKDLGKNTGSVGKAKLENLGPEAIGKVDREFGISKASDPRAALKAAQTQVGAVRSAAYDTISKAGGDADMGAVARRLDDLQADFGQRAGTRPFAEDVATLRGSLLERYGGTGKVSVKALQDEISAIDEGAYGGNYSNPKTAAIVKRRTAGALRDVLNKNLDAVAQLGSEEADAVATAREANQKFGVLKTMEPIVKAKAVKATFAPSFTEQFIKAPVKTMVHAGADVAKNAREAASSLPIRAAQAVQNVAPTANPAAVAKLIQASRLGASRMQLQAQAQQDGVPVEIAMNIAQQAGR